jgi:hypothetical protein
MKAARGVHNGDDLDFIQPEPPEALAKLDLLRVEMAALCGAIKAGGDALTPARALREEKLIAKSCFNAVEQWQSAKGGKRKMLLRSLVSMIPDLTLDD